MKKPLLALFVMTVFASVANAQALTNTTLTTVAMGGAVYLKADGTAQKEANVNVAHIKLEIGTLANGTFTPWNPPKEKILNGLVFVNNQTTYSHTFTTAFAAGTYTVKVQMYKQPFIGNPVAYGAHAYATVTIP